MKYDAVLKEIKRHTWWSEEAPGLEQTILYPLHAFVLLRKLIHKPYLSIAILIFKGDYFYERTPDDDRYEVYKHFYSSMQANPDYIRGLMKKWQQCKKEYFRIIGRFARQRDNLSNSQLWDSYTKFLRQYRDFSNMSAAIEGSDQYTTHYLESMARKEIPGASESKLKDILMVLTAPKVLSFMEEERIGFLKLCVGNYEMLRKGRTNKILQGEALQLSEKYNFVLNNFKDIGFLDAQHFIKAGREEGHKPKKQLQKELNSLQTKIQRLEKEAAGIKGRYNLSKGFKLHLKVVEQLGECIDFRKSSMINTNHYIAMYCCEIGKRFGLSEANVLRLTLDEIEKMFRTGKMPPAKEVAERRKLTAYVYTYKDGRIIGDRFTGARAQKILDLTSHKVEGVIKGNVANAPVSKITGRVQVILDASQHIFEKGNILVTSMTRPEYVPMMRKAAAIITDEGGLTCHAAIISRELGIPCIIGARIAAKMLKDGDIVEIDCVSGVVRKL